MGNNLRKILLFGVLLTSVVTVIFATTTNDLNPSTKGKQLNNRDLDPPAPVFLCSPADSATGIQVLETFSWFGDNPAVDYYMFSLGTDNPPTNILNELNVGNTSSYQPEKLLFNTTYYWTVTAYANSQNSPTSTVYTFTTVDGVPAYPDPPDQQTNVSINTGLLWGGFNFADYFLLSIGTSPGNYNIFDREIVYYNNYYHYSEWQYGHYYWKVVTVNGSQEIAGPEWEFTTVPDPALNLPYTQSFDSPTMPVNWQSYAASGPLDYYTTTTPNSAWIVGDYLNQPGINQAAKIQVYEPGYNWLITPPLNSNNRYVKMEFDLGFTATGNSFNPGIFESDDRFLVAVNSYNSSMWFTQNILKEFSGSTMPNTTTIHVECNIYNYPGAEQIRLAFVSEHQNPGNSYDLFVDNISFTLSDLPPLPCTELSPYQEEEGVAKDLTLTWEVNPEASGYKVFFNNHLVSVQSGNSYKIPYLLNSDSWYSWYITPFNEFGDCPTIYESTFGTTSDPIVNQIPYFVSFRNFPEENFSSDWNIVDNNNDWSTWFVSSYTYEEEDMAAYIGAYYSEMDDWMFMPPITLEAGVAYNLNFNYGSFSGLNISEYLEVKVGNSSDPVAMNTTLLTVNNINEHFRSNVGSAVFIPEITDTYYFGFHAVNTDANFEYCDLAVENIRVVKKDHDYFYTRGTAFSGEGIVNLTKMANPAPVWKFYNYFYFYPLPYDSDISMQVNWDPEYTGMPNTAYVFTFTGNMFSGSNLYINHNLGYCPEYVYYRFSASDSWLTAQQSFDWDSESLSFDLPQVENSEFLQVAFPHLGPNDYPDLRIQMVAWNKLVLTSTDLLNVRVLLQNTGNADVTQPFYVDLFKNSPSVPESNIRGDYYSIVNGLAAGDTLSVFFNNISYPGATTFWSMYAVVDNDQLVTELNEIEFNSMGPMYACWNCLPPIVNVNIQYLSSEDKMYITWYNYMIDVSRFCLYGGTDPNGADATLIATTENAVPWFKVSPVHGKFFYFVRAQLDDVTPARKVSNRKKVQMQAK